MKLYSYRLTSKMQFCDLLFVENLEIIMPLPTQLYSAQFRGCLNMESIDKGF